MIKIKQKGLTSVELLVVMAIIIILGVIVYLITFPAKASACGGWFEASCGSATDQQYTEQQAVTNAINKLSIAAPIPQLNDSLERKNISKRLTTFSDPNKVSYIYLVNFGRVMSFYTIKGKVTSGSKRLTSTQRFVSCDTGEYDGDCQTESPELDGTYGTSAPYIYFWTTDNVYVQWSGDYMLVDQPLQLTSQPELTRVVK